MSLKGYLYRRLLKKREIPQENVLKEIKQELSIPENIVAMQNVPPKPMVNAPIIRMGYKTKKFRKRILECTETLDVIYNELSIHRNTSPWVEETLMKVRQVKEKIKNSIKPRFRGWIGGQTPDLNELDEKLNPNPNEKLNPNLNKCGEDE
jgi:methylthioribose-1-phosphate isomerase